jgi:superfamily II DNA or RNA helicase
MTPTHNIELREYQREAIAAVRDSWVQRGVRRPLIGLPTGTGKTVVFSTIAESAVRRGSRVLILAHRDELLSQAADKLLQVAPDLAMQIGFVQGKRDDYMQPVTIASVQTLCRRRRMQRLHDAGVKFDVVIVDEAHHAAAASYRFILDELGCMREGGPLTIGVTATPQREDGKALADVWQDVVYHRDMLSMIREGFLCDLRGVQVRLQLNMDNVRVSRGDYVDADSAEALVDANAPQHVVSAWQRKARGRRTIVFTPTIALAQRMAVEFQEAGVRAESVSGVPLDERREILKRFHTGETTVVTNAQVLTEGFDEPAVDCIVIARPTRSQTMYVQMVGRGTRTFPGKQDCVILDVVGASTDNDLTTLPRLFGIPESEDADIDGAASLEDEGVAVVAGRIQDEQVRAGRIVARQVELFNRRDLAWVLAKPGLWTLGAGDTQVILEADTADRWTASAYRRGGGSEQITTNVDLGYAMGAAEDYARRQGSFAEVLVDRAAAWRQLAPSNGQLRTLRKNRIAIPTGMTRGEASDAISAMIATSRARRDA